MQIFTSVRGALDRSKSLRDRPLVNGDVEVHKNWDFSPYNPALKELLERAFFVEDIPFAYLDDVRKWKAAF